MDLLRAAVRYRMFSPGDRVLAAVSGGPDSVAMLHALHSRADHFGITLHVAHLNHGIRGEASDADAEFVARLARDIGVGCTVEKTDVPTLRRKMRMGTEEAARSLRHKFLQQTAAELCANRIALGHTADDRAESVLLNVIRGTGVHGLGSIRPVSGSVVRPLIDTTRAEVENYITEHDIPFRTDHTNLDPAYTRNRVRLKLLPLLEKHYNPQARSALVRLAEIAAMTSDLMDCAAWSAAVSALYRDAFDAGLISMLPRALQHEVVRQEILRIKGDLNDVSMEQVSRVVDALECGSDFVITLPSGRIYAERVGDTFCIRAPARASRGAAFEYRIAVPGITILSEAEQTLTVDVVNNPIPTKLPIDEALIDVEAVTGELRARNPRPGDRITLFGLGGTKKLQDVFTDAKVPRNERARAAVLVDDEKILWVVGVARAEQGRVTQSTRRALLIRAERAP